MPQDLLSSGVDLDGKRTREAEFSLASEEYIRERLPLTADVDGARPREEGGKRGKRQHACVRVRLREGRHRQVGGCRWSLGYIVVHNAFIWCGCMPFE